MCNSFCKRFSCWKVSLDVLIEVKNLLIDFQIFEEKRDWRTQWKSKGEEESEEEKEKEEKEEEEEREA